MVFSDVESAHLWRRDLESAGLDYIRTGFWWKVGGAPQFTGDRPAVAVEAITICHRPGRKRWNGGGKQGLWIVPMDETVCYEVPIVLSRGAGEKRVHTTQKPLRLMRQLVEDFTDPGDLVMDPFAGSGSTGVAALCLGRRFLGWEIDDNYHALAAERLADASPEPFVAARGQQRLL
jgi:site-specific DNA-methyltransferase (adenine-specific)